MENYHLLFFLRKNRSKGGKAPIYLRITVGASRSDTSTKIWVEPKLWDAERGRVKGNKEEARVLNNSLDTFAARIRQQYNTALEKGERITTKILKEKVSSKKNVTTKNLLTFFKIRLEIIKNYVDEGKTNYSYGTYKRYKVTLGKLISFLQHEYDLLDIPLEDLSYSFMEDFQIYLQIQDKLKYNTATRYMSILKCIVNHAYKRGIIKSNPFAAFKFETDEGSSRTYLTEEELKSIMLKQFQTDRLSNVRDVFVFACYTGMAFSDIKKLSQEHIKEENGEQIIEIYRTKTKVRCLIPILPKAQEIINKYQRNPENLQTQTLLPIKSNQKFNEYLHEIANLCGIQKHVTSHVGRHTFATTITLSNGIPLETVSKMLGHNSIRTTQIYSKVRDSKIIHEMNQLKAKLNANQLSTLDYSLN